MDSFLRTFLSLKNLIRLCPEMEPLDRNAFSIEMYSDTSAMVKILYISGRMTGATRGICVSVTSLVNSTGREVMSQFRLLLYFFFFTVNKINIQLRPNILRK